MGKKDFIHQVQLMRNSAFIYQPQLLFQPRIKSQNISVWQAFEQSQEGTLITNVQEKFEGIGDPTANNSWSSFVMTPNEARGR